MSMILGLGPNRQLRIPWHVLRSARYSTVCNIQNQSISSRIKELNSSQKNVLHMTVMFLIVVDSKQEPTILPQSLHFLTSACDARWHRGGGLSAGVESEGGLTAFTVSYLIDAACKSSLWGGKWGKDFRTHRGSCIFVCPSMSLVYYVKHRSSMIEQSEPEMKLDLTQTNNLVCCVDTGDWVSQIWYYMCAPFFSWRVIYHGSPNWADFKNCMHLHI